MEYGLQIMYDSVGSESSDRANLFKPLLSPIKRLVIFFDMTSTPTDEGEVFGLTAGQDVGCSVGLVDIG